MPEAARLLIVGEDAAAAAWLRACLQASGCRGPHEVVADAAHLARALAQPTAAIVLGLPSRAGQLLPPALAAVLAQAVAVPLIAVGHSLDAATRTTWLERGAAAVVDTGEIDQLQPALAPFLSQPPPPGPAPGPTVPRHEQLLRILIDAMPDLIYVKDHDSRFVVANAAVARFMGAANPADLIGHVDADFYPSDLAARYRNDEQRVLDTGESLIDREEMAVDAAGHVRWLSTTKVALRDDTGAVTGLVGIGRDITTRYLMEEALAEGETRFRELFNQMHNGVIVCEVRSAEFHVRDINRAAQTIEQVYADEVTGKTLRELFPPLPDTPLYHALERVATGGAPEHVEPFYYEDARGGGWRECDVYRVPSGNVVISYEDVTRRIETEQALRDKDDELRQAQRLESVGRLAGGVACDFNNLLCVIIGTSDLLLERLPEDDPRRADVREIREAGERASSLIRQLLAAGARQILQPQRFNPNALIAPLASQLRQLVGNHSQLRTHLDPHVGEVRADRRQTEQILLALARNSTRNLAPDGALIIETFMTELDEDYVRAHHLNLRPGRCVAISVSDTGPGLPPEQQACAFDGATPAQPGVETDGMGLPAARRLARQAGGDVTLYSEPGRGTTLTLLLPALADDAAPNALPEAIGAPGHETVLVVDDDENARRRVRRFLTQWGYQVLDAESLADAHQLLASHTVPVHLLLVDTTRLDAVGRSALGGLHQEHPDLKVVVASGFPEAAARQHGCLPVPGAEFVPKPYQSTVLVRRIHDTLLGRPRPPPVPASAIAASAEADTGGTGPRRLSLRKPVVSGPEAGARGSPP